MFSILHFDRIGSTSDEARRLANEGAAHGLVVHADEQTAGRGRLARSWYSPPGNLYLSVLLRLTTPPQRRAELSFVSAVAVAETVDTLLPKHVRASLKWPNDVLVAGAKIAGILLEDANDTMIVGIGLNVLHAPDGGAYKTTTIVAQGGLATVHGALDILLDRFGKRLAMWEAEGFGPIREAWLSRAHPVGTKLRVIRDGTMIEGTFDGLDADGALLLATETGLQRLLTGDVSRA